MRFKSVSSILTDSYRAGSEIGDALREIVPEVRNLTNRQLNRLMNWENIKIFFSPGMFRGNYFVRKREKGIRKLLLNNFDLFRGWFLGDQFRSRHRF